MKRYLMFCSLLTLALAFSTAAADKGMPKNLEEIEFPPITEYTLDNGLKLMTLEHHEQPVVIFNLEIRTGAVQDPEGKAGLADLTMSMLKKGTEKYTGPEIAEKIDFIGGDFSSEAKTSVSDISFKVLKKHYDEALTVLQQVVTVPVFPEAEFDRLRRRSISGLMRETDDTSTLADNAFNKELYGDHPYARPVVGTMDSLININREDLVKFYNTYYRPNNAVLVVAGDIDPYRVRQSVEKAFKDWEKAETPEKDWETPENPEGYKIVLLDKPDATQSQIRMGHIGIRRNNPDFQAIKLMNKMLGMGAESRLMKEVRQVGGYTYDIHSIFDFNMLTGSFRISTFTKNESVLDTIRTVFDVLKETEKNGFDAAELSLTRAFYAGIITVGMETPSSIADQLQYLDFYGLGRDYIRHYRKNVYEVALAETDRAFKKYVDPNNMVIVVVGKADEVKEQLEKLGEVEVRPYVDKQLIGKVMSVLQG